MHNHVEGVAVTLHGLPSAGSPSSLPQGAAATGSPAACSPISVTDSRHAAAQPQKRTRGDSKILIIDDEPSIIEVLRGQLKEDGYANVASTTDPFAALPLFQEFQPDLVILDLLMPGFSGLEVLAQLRGVIPTVTYLPILFVTGDWKIDSRREALKNGATDFVTKPYDRVEILARIGNLLETRNLHLQLVATNQRLLAEVAERTQTEEALRESEARLRFTLDATGVGEWEIDLATGASRRSLRHDQIFGYEQLLPEWNYEIFERHIHPDDRPAVRAAYLDRQHAGRSWEFECRIVRADGQERFVWVKGAVQEDAVGGLRMGGLKMDITARKLAEQELERRTAQAAAVAALGQRALIRNHLLGLFEEAVVVVAQTLGVGYAKILELQADGQSLLLRAGVGWKEGLVGQAVIDAEGDTLAGQTLLTGKPVIVEDLRTERRFREPPLWPEHGIVSGISVVIGRDGWTFGVLGAHSTAPRVFTGDHVHFLQALANLLAAAAERTLIDQSLHEAKEAAERANAAKSEFLSRMSHELRTPLHAILGFGQVMEDERRDAADAESIEQILKAGRHLLGLVDELLAIARPSLPLKPGTASVALSGYSGAANP